MSLFTTTLQGHLGADPELTEVQGQNGPYKKVSFSVCASRDYGDGKDWIPCVMYGKRAEVIEKYFRKGSEILVEGRFESYKPKDDQNRKNWILRVKDFHFCGSAKSESKPEYQPEGFEEVMEDIPF